jgi:hypothetical protein
MKKAFALAAAAVAATMVPTAAHAVTNVQTGTNGTWTIQDSGGNTLPTRVPTTGERPSVWSPNQPGSVWISPDLGDGNAFPNQGSSPPGLYTFIGIISLADLGNNQTWNMTWWADNIVRSIFVNGVQIFSNPAGSSNAQEFAGNGISRIFENDVWQNGNNEIRFVVQNGTGTTGNPVGLRVNGILTAVPEPGTWMLMILGLGAVGFAMRRRQNATVRFQFA